MTAGIVILAPFGSVPAAPRERTLTMEPNRHADGGTHSTDAEQGVDEETKQRTADAAGTGTTGGEVSNGLSRRALLKTSGLALAGAVGLHTLTGSGLADDDEIMELDLRDGVPDVSDAPQDEDEVIFNVHGYSASSVSVSEAETLQTTLRDLDNQETVTAVTWDASGGAGSALANARSQGGVFADWMDQYLDENPGTTIRILGHSMGGIVTFEFLSSANGRFTIANADVIGSYEESDAPCEGSEFHDAIDDASESTNNYYSTNDGIARLGDGPADCSGDALPENYSDVDVSDSVGGHVSYKSSSGCVQAIIDNYVDGVDRGEGGTSTPTPTETPAGTGTPDTPTETPTETPTPTPDSGAPTIDTFDVEEERYGDDPDVHWEVSDPDGDLETVESVLISEHDNTLDSETSYVWGDSASGTHELDTWYDTQDTVELTVTDEDGNSTTETADAP